VTTCRSGRLPRRAPRQSDTVQGFADRLRKRDENDKPENCGDQVNERAHRESRLLNVLKDDALHAPCSHYTYIAFEAQRDM